MEIIFRKFNLKDAWEVLFLLGRVNGARWKVVSRVDVSCNSLATPNKSKKRLKKNETLNHLCQERCNK